MGFVDKLRKLVSARVRGVVTAPSDRFASQVDAMAFIIEQTVQDGWGTFEATDGSRECVIQVAGDCINTLHEDVNVSHIVRTIGNAALAEAIEDEQMLKIDRTMHRLPKASPREVAEIVHAIFLHHFGLPSDYRVSCSFQS